MEHTEEHFSYSGGSTTLHIFPATDPNAACIVALHGFTGLGSDFALCANTAHGAFPWVCPDLPGHGDHETNLPYIDAVYGLLEALLNRYPQAELLGYSMGARLALNYSLDHPSARISHLHLISGTAGIEKNADRSDRWQNDIKLAQSIKEIGLKSFLEKWSQHPLIKSQQNIPSSWKDAMRENRLKKHTSKKLAEALLQFSPGKLNARWNDLPNLNPLLSCYYGEQDLKYRKLAQRFPNYSPQTQLVKIPQCGHAPHLENCIHFVKQGAFTKKYQK
jgi:2-succinyl-6-hydroxy-2,4-cyclohexadiene-1-carboxylate synthase